MTILTKLGSIGESPDFADGVPRMTDKSDVLDGQGLVSP